MCVSDVSIVGNPTGVKMGLFGKKKTDSDSPPGEGMSRKDRKAAEKFDKGSNLISQGKFDDALKNLDKSIKKGNCSPDVYILKAMLELRPVYPGHLQAAKEVFDKYPGIDVEYGNFTVNSSKLSLECELLDIALACLVAADKDKTVENGQALIQIANRYAEIGDDNLILENLFKNTTVSGRNYSLTLFARGYETLSEAVKWDDPKKAAEYMQQALFYNQDRENAEDVAKNKEFIDGVSKTVHCWFCGKEVVGRNVHFVPMYSKITEPILSQTDLEATIPTNDAQYVYACRACYSAIDFNGYKHFKKACEYTDGKISELKAYTDARCNDLQGQVNNLVDAVNSINRRLR